MSPLLQDVRFALRRMRRELAFTLVVVSTLALAIGPTTAVFSVVYQVLLRPLPYPEPEQLVRLFQSTLQHERRMVPYPTLRVWRERTRTFQGIEGLCLMDRTLTGDGPADRVLAGRMTAGLLSLLGVKPELGRTFGPEMEEPGRERVVLLSHTLWKDRFGGNRDIVGRMIALDGQPHTVVGVLPASFRFAPRVEVWIPLVPNPLMEENGPRDIFVGGVGRLRPGISLEQARAELEELAASVAREEIPTGETTSVRVFPLHAHVVEGSRKQLWLLAGVMALVLLVACANVANLLLARANMREREVAVRAALGASHVRLMQQFLVESMMLALAGGAAGLLLEPWAMDLLRMLVPSAVLSPEAVRMDAHVLGIATALSLLTSLLFGLVPALRVARADRRGALGGLREGRSTTGRSGALSTLVVVQVALALVPLVGAGLMLRTLHALQKVPLGFEPRGVRVADVILPLNEYQDDARQRLLFAELLERVRALPRVQSAGLASAVPLGGSTSFVHARLPGEPASVMDTRQSIHLRTVSKDYFATMGIALKAGRVLDGSDGPNTPPVMVVNETFARRYFPGVSALGQRVKLTLDEEIFQQVEGEGGDIHQESIDEAPETFRQVVGVMGDVHHESIGEAPSAEVYLPMEQFPVQYMVLAVRATQDTTSLASALQEQLRAMDPDLPRLRMSSMEGMVDESLARTRLLGTLLATIAVLGLVLAGLGLYGVLAYSVSQRTRELGIRIALGATNSQVLWWVVRRGVLLTAVGMTLGLVGAAVLARGLSGMLHGVETFDAVTFTVVPTLLGSVALLASWLPARRALRIPPHEALNADS